ncbi:MAG: hypothetical protein WCJ26_04035 [bacterium]
MNKEIIKDEGKWLLEAINEQHEAIHAHREKIPQIEFDILMENVRKFYENMHILQRLNDPALYPGTKKEAVKVKEPEVVAARPDVPKIPEPVTFQNTPVQFKPAGPPPSVKQDQPSPAKKSSRPQEIDLFASDEPTYSIRLKEAREKSLGPKIPSERIENLKAAITINEKFMFINELFDGNLREYNETVETLNGFKALDQAADYLDLMRKKNFWNTGSNAFKKLKELVERRF